MMKKVYSVEEFIENQAHFAEALELLRDLINSTELNESVKWSAPVYDLNGKNVLSLGAFKHHFGIFFFQGVFLKDEHDRLVAAQEKTKGLRQMRFESLESIDKNIVLSYIKEAIENQKLGKEIKIERSKKEVIIPNFLQEALEKDAAFMSSFTGLTPGKQREYCEHIASAKRETTKATRLEKIKIMILKGQGLNDKYK